jgi:DNA-binding transcriptional regulator LsrR (DeoR family)
MEIMAKPVRSILQRADVESVTRTKLPPNASVSKRWKFRRNAVIVIAYLNGISQRTLAEVFDLPRSTVASIIEEISGENSAGCVRIQDHADRFPLPAMPAKISVGQKRKFLRNNVIYITYCHGFSQRTLADVFDLPRSRVFSILGAFR